MTTPHDKALEAAANALANAEGNEASYLVDARTAITAYLDTLLADPQVVEAVAKAVCEHFVKGKMLHQPTYHYLPPDDQHYWREKAHSALSVIRNAAGVR